MLTSGLGPGVWNEDRRKEVIPDCTQIILASTEKSLR